MGPDEIRQFLSHLATDRTVAAATQNQALSSLLFLYRDVLGVELPYVEGIERARRPARVPVVLTRAEAGRVLSRAGGAYRLMAGLLYGSGLRLMECVRLRVKDMDFGYRQITVRDGKGEKDRRTVLPASLAGPLRRHLERVRLLHEEDLRAGTGASTCPTPWSGSTLRPPPSGSGSGSSPRPSSRRTRALARCAATTPPRTCCRRR